jgi:hypothetical protein
MQEMAQRGLKVKSGGGVHVLVVNQAYRHQWCARILNSTQQARARSAATNASSVASHGSFAGNQRVLNTDDPHLQLQPKTVLLLSD